jgi:hypothetical protein
MSEVAMNIGLLRSEPYNEALSPTRPGQTADVPPIGSTGLIRSDEPRKNRWLIRIPIAIGWPMPVTKVRRLRPTLDGPVHQITTDPLDNAPNRRRFHDCAVRGRFRHTRTNHADITGGGLGWSMAEWISQQPSDSAAVRSAVTRPAREPGRVRSRCNGRTCPRGTV